MRTRVRNWRWRRNPLRRRCDVVEAWTALVVAALLLVGAPLAGVLTGWWAHGEARAVAAQQRADRHEVHARVVGRTPDTPPSVDGGSRHTTPVAVRWVDARGATHTATARVPAGTRTGDAVDVWFDAHGHDVAAPPTESAVWQHTLSMGVAATGGTVAVVLLVHGVVRRVSLRHRLDEWDRDWALTEPLWTRRRPA
ncbi:hypothetical protein AB0E88_31755 [Streptomyces sp. NPDC028635]|uniref:Rv1733c family protein n=1 Tax=Streptomyces sp. NPDC028635 TaxID=3154800 RepID=UPI0033FAF5B2